MSADKNIIINEIENLLGSEGTRELAERVFADLRADNRISYDDPHGLVLDPAVDLVAVAAGFITNMPKEKRMEPTACPWCGCTELNAANEDTNPTDGQGNLLAEYQCSCGKVFYA